MIGPSIILLAYLTFLSNGENVEGKPKRFAGWNEGSNSRIIGGSPVTEIRNRPYHAAIEMNYINAQICSGAIISTEWVVTSGHCVAQLIPEDILIRVGTVRNAFGGEVYEVSQVEIHPDFEQVWFTSVDYDVGAVKTATPIVLSLGVKPIALPPRETELPVNTPATVSGWGTISADENGVRPRTLQVGTVQIMSRPACNVTREYIGNITSRMLCAGNSAGQDVCIGDNGGPLVVANVLYGVVSWGIGCGVAQFLSVFTSLANPEIRDYITQVTGV